MTAVYEYIKSANNMKREFIYSIKRSTLKPSDYNIVILEMELSGKLYNGMYRFIDDVYIESEIKSIKKVKESE